MLPVSGTAALSTSEPAVVLESRVFSIVLHPQPTTIHYVTAGMATVVKRLRRVVVAIRQPVDEIPRDLLSDVVIRQHRLGS